jgi:DNA processing protein
MTQPLERYHYWLAVTLTPGVGARLAAELLKRFGAPERVFAASLTELEACGLPAPVAQSLHSGAPLKAAEQELEKIRQLGCRLLAWDEPEYPPLLKEIYDPPVLLYCRGDVAASRPTVWRWWARVRPSPYGLQVTERLSEELSARGLTIVSGLARGIDSAAHRGALKLGGRQDGRCAGLRHRSGLSEGEQEAARADGSERLRHHRIPHRHFSAPQNFPIRNRIIAGLSWGVVVVEGSRYSGSLITGRLAMEYNRQVYGIPGNITNQKSHAPNTLIKQGAKLVETWEDVIEELPTPVRSEILERLAAAGSTALEQKELPLAAELSEVERAVFRILKADEALHVDQVVEATALTPSDVLPACLISK